MVGNILGFYFFGFVVTFIGIFMSANYWDKKGLDPIILSVIPIWPIFWFLIFNKVGVLAYKTLKRVWRVW